MIKPTFMIIFLVFLTNTIIAQNILTENLKESLNYQIHIRNNPNDKSKELLFKDGYILIDSFKNVSVDGNKSGDCGCEPIENGFWIYYYNNGKIKSQGSYNCGEKIDTWIDFYNNGNLKRIINYKYPYSESFIYEFKDTLNLRRISAMKHGQFLEYFKNGKIKTSGHYEIVHVNSKLDSLVSFDFETYEEVYTKISGNFWLPKSIKTGAWKFYNSEGELLHIINYNENLTNTKDMNCKYWEVFELFKK